MVPGILSITICPQDDMFEKIEVSESYERGSYDVSINTLVDESFSSVVTNKKYIEEVAENMKFNLGFEEFEDSFLFYRFVLEHCYDQDFFVQADQLYINGIYEDVAVYLKRNPELLSKEIIFSESLELDKNTCDRLKVVFKDIPNIKFRVKGNRELVTINEYEKTIEAIDSIVEKILRYDYSPLEQLILAYDLIRDRFYVMEDETEDYSISRDLTSALLGDKIVCVGFANIFDAVCTKLNIKSMTFLLANKNDSTTGHARNMLHLEDEKYGIEGLYFFDPTFDCKKDDKNNFLLSYRFFAKDYKEMDTLSHGIYFPQDFKLFDNENFFEMLDRSEEIGDLRDALSILTDYRINTLLKFLGKESISPLSMGSDYDVVVDAAYDIKERADRSIGAETFLKALYTVRKNQYYENPGKYMFDVQTLTQIITNSRFRADDSGEQTLLSMLGFNQYYGKEASEEKVKKFIEENGLDYDIGRVKLARTLRTILEAKIAEENKGRKL